MALDFLHEFQVKLYSVLSKAQYIQNNVEKIYISSVQDGKSPFLLIKIIKLGDFSRPGMAIYNVEFIIELFARDKNYILLINIADEILKTLTPLNCQGDTYIVAGLKFREITFTKANDLILNKGTMYFDSLIKQN